MVSILCIHTCIHTSLLTDIPAYLYIHITNHVHPHARTFVKSAVPTLINLCASNIISFSNRWHCDSINWIQMFLCYALFYLVLLFFFLVSPDSMSPLVWFILKVMATISQRSFAYSIQREQGIFRYVLIHALHNDSKYLQIMLIQDTIIERWCNT